MHMQNNIFQVFLRLAFVLATCSGLLPMVFCQDKINQTNEQFDKELRSSDKVLEKLREISAMMNESSDAISDGNLSGNPLQVRNKIVTELKQLIPEKMNNDQKSENSKEESGANSRLNANSSATDKVGGQQNVNNEAGVKDAQNRQQQVRELLGEAWGHLPQRLRQKLIDSASPTFLKGYEKQIEEYYKLLADMSKEKSE